jgi:hypothetical protein
MSVETFYSATSQICFMLLVFWWAVVQFRHADWVRNPARRRMSYAVALHFILPGIMSLVALLSTQALILWRAAFAIAGISGVVVTALIITSRQEEAVGGRFTYIGQGLMIIPYGLIAVLAVAPELVRALGVGLSALEVEAILVSLIIFLGVNVAWSLFMEPAREG